MLKTNASLDVQHRAGDSDIFGALYQHLFKTFLKFSKQMQDKSPKFKCTVFCEKPMELCGKAGDHSSFDLIDVSGHEEHSGIELMMMESMLIHDGVLITRSTKYLEKTGFGPGLVATETGNSTEHGEATARGTEFISSVFIKRHVVRDSTLHSSLVTARLFGILEMFKDYDAILKNVWSNDYSTSIWG